MPFLMFLSPMAWLKLGLVAAALVGLFWLVDEIGDRRELKVRAQFAEAARKKNIDISAFNSADDSVAVLMERTLVMYAAQAGQAEGNKCPASPPQAAAITAIRRVK